MKISKIHVWKTVDFGKFLPAHWVIDIYMEGDESNPIKIFSETPPKIVSEVQDCESEKEKVKQP
jgi:hypothetical protein